MTTATFTEKQRQAIEAMEGARSEGVALSEYAKAHGLIIRAQTDQNAAGSHARITLDFIRELYLVERALWDRDHPVSVEHRIRVRAELSAPIVAKFHVWLEALARGIRSLKAFDHQL
jgi:transposase IS66 family protein